MDELRWDDLRTFLAIARTGSLAGAARDLGVNHSTVWRRVTALEESLGTTLFERPGYEPTPAGEAMLRHAEQVEDEVHALMRAVTGRDQEPAGQVRVATTLDLVPILAPHLRTFVQRHPRIQLELLLGAHLVDLERREADVALRPTRQPPERAVGRRVCDIAWTAYGTQTDADWLGYTPSLDHLDAVKWWRQTWPEARVALRLSSVSGMAEAVRAGLGRGLLPAHLGDHLPGVRRLAPPDPTARSSLWLLVHADRRRTARVRLLVDFLFEQLQADVPRLEGLAPDEPAG